METVSTSPEQTQEIAQDLAKNFKGGEVVALLGNLGAGKTTFIGGLARGLGIKKRILSPTFVFVRSYPFTINLGPQSGEAGRGPHGTVSKPLTFHHVDLYRAGSDDLSQLGLEEIFQPDSVVAIEWPEKIKNLPPKKRIDVVISIIDENSRKIIINRHIYSSSDRAKRRNREVTLKTSNITKAAQILKTGGVVVFPTDTVYGIGCRWDFPKSVARIYRIKGAPKNQVFPILVSSVEQAKKLVNIDKTVQKLMDKYWPGALTIILQAKNRDQKIGIRLPGSAVTRWMIEQAGVPIIGTSANIHGKSAVKSSKDLDPVLTSQVNYVLEGECERGVESTVVDATFDPPKILRLGAVKLQPKHLRGGL